MELQSRPLPAEVAVCSTGESLLLYIAGGFAKDKAFPLDLAALVLQHLKIEKREHCGLLYLALCERNGDKVEAAFAKEGFSVKGLRSQGSSPPKGILGAWSLS